MWQLPEKKTKAIYQSIVELVLNHIKAGRLLPGEKLPPERQLAAAFGVNRSTVVHALDELEAMGVIIRKQGSGTLVNEGKWGIYTGASTNWRSYLSGAFNHRDPYLEKVSQLARNSEGQVVDAYTGELPLELIPSLALPSISWNDFLVEESHQDELGYLPLRQQIVTHLNRERDLSLTTDQLLLTSGAQQALFLIIQVLLQSGDAVAIEEPSSFYPLPIFQAAGIRLYGVPVDSQGMKVELLEQMIIKRKIKMVLVNPNFQNPTGTTMSLSRRKQLIVLCQHYQIPIVEDDVFSQLYFSEKNKPVLLKQLDSENVIYIGSLSKILGATTKIGWLSAPVKVAQQLADARKEMDFTLSIFPQVLASSALSNRQFDQQIKVLRQELKRRRDVLVGYLKAFLGREVSYVIPEGGYYLWLQVEKRTLKQGDFDFLLELGGLVAPSFTFGVTCQSLRINFARLTDMGALRLVKLIHKMIYKG